MLMYTQYHKGPWTVDQALDSDGDFSFHSWVIDPKLHAPRQCFCSIHSKLSCYLCIYHCLWRDTLSVGGITVLCHFRKNDLMSVISSLTSFTFCSLFHVISISFCRKTCRGPKFLKK